MVTLISQDLSEFALHVRAFLGLPVGAIRQYGPAASAVILPQLTSQNVTFSNFRARSARDCSCVCSASRRLTVLVVWASRWPSPIALMRRWRARKPPRRPCWFRIKKPGRVRDRVWTSRLFRA
jgi:hypothetical protein